MAEGLGSRTLLILIILFMILVSLISFYNYTLIEKTLTTTPLKTITPISISSIEKTRFTLTREVFVKNEYPVLSPGPEWIDAAATYNPAVIYVNNTFYMFYRAQYRFHGTSVIMLAISRDGIHFNKTYKVVLYPTLLEEMNGGCEDPRIVVVNNTYYMTYTAYDGRNARLALARSKDLIHWEKLGVVFPNWTWSKSGAILPVKIYGKYIMYFGDSNIWIAYSTDMIHWVTSKDWIVLRPRPGYFDSKLVEPGPSPILTDQGILLIYNGADENNKYSVGWVLFSKDDPTKVIARCEEPILVPEYSWEINGQVPNVVFAMGLVIIGNKWYLYYGAADTYVGVAIGHIDLKIQGE